MDIICSLANLYYLVIIARAISSFFPITSDSPFAPIVSILYKATEPVFAPVRRYVPPFGGFDFTPLIVLFALRLVTMLLLGC